MDSISRHQIICFNLRRLSRPRTDLTVAARSVIILSAQADIISKPPKHTQPNTVTPEQLPTTAMCYEQHDIYTCYCEYKVWHKCSIAIAHDATEKAANDAAIAAGRPQDVKTTGSPCSKSLKYDAQQWNWICQHCRDGRDPREPGEPGEGKVMPGRAGRRVREEWDGTHGTPENHA